MPTGTAIGVPLDIRLADHRRERRKLREAWCCGVPLAVRPTRSVLVVTHPASPTRTTSAGCRSPTPTASSGSRASSPAATRDAGRTSTSRCTRASPRPRRIRRNSRHAARTAAERGDGRVCDECVHRQRRQPACRLARDQPPVRRTATRTKWRQSPAACKATSRRSSSPLPASSGAPTHVSAGAHHD